MGTAVVGPTAKTVARPGTRPGASRKGFTLTEVLLGIGVLGVGLSMAGALFPAAIKHSQSSVNDLVGTHICQNALAIAQMRLTHPLRYRNDALVPTRFMNCTSQLGEIDRQYPLGSGGSEGFAVFGRHTASGADYVNDNSYELMIIAHAKTDPNSTIEDVRIRVNIVDYEQGSKLQVQDTYSGNLGMGSLVFDESGKWHAIVLSKVRSDYEGEDGRFYSDFVVDRKLDTGSGLRARTLVEQNAGVTVGPAQAMSVLFVKTALKEVE